MFVLWEIHHFSMLLKHYLQRAFLSMSTFCHRCEYFRLPPPDYNNISTIAWFILFTWHKSAFIVFPVLRIHPIYCGGEIFTQMYGYVYYTYHHITLRNAKFKPNLTSEKQPNDYNILPIIFLYISLYFLNNTYKCLDFKLF